MIIKVEIKYDDKMGDPSKRRAVDVDLSAAVADALDAEITLQAGAIDTIEIDVYDTAKNVVHEYL